MGNFVPEGKLCRQSTQMRKCTGMHPDISTDIDIYTGADTDIDVDLSVTIHRYRLHTEREKCINAGIEIEIQM